MAEGRVRAEHSEEIALCSFRRKLSLSMRPLFLFLLLLLAPLSACAQDVLPPNYAPIAQAYVVLDLDSGRVLYSKNPDQRLFPASTTKAMTALVAYENGTPGQIIHASFAAAHTGESAIYLQQGEARTLDELLHAAMIRSANDACVAIAEGVGGSVPRFVGMMNAKAKQLGLKNTHFVNPHGLHDPQHYTSARDLAAIARAFTQVPFLNRIVAEKTAKIGGNSKIGPVRLLINRNKLLFRWPMCDGLKTGSTKEAGHCLIATATTRDAKGKPWRLLSVVLKSKGNFTYLDTQWLLKKAFASFQPQVVATPGQTLWRGAIKGGAAPVEATTTHAIELPLRKDERGDLKSKVEMLDLKAPLKRGQLVGRANYFAGGRLIASVPLEARANVGQTFLASAIPVVEKRVFSPTRSQKLAWLSAFFGLLAILLLKRRQRMRRRRRAKRHAQSKPTFEPLDPRDFQPR